MFVPLVEATAGTCGAKAGALGVLLKAGLRVPNGFVVPFDVHDAVGSRALPEPLMQALERELAGLGDPAVAVRSSAADEDASGASAAGRYESLLAVRGVRHIADAVRACWASLHSPRATASRTLAGGRAGERLAMAVIVQRHIDAEVSGVMFTPASPDEPTVIEASWGLGPSIVAGTVTPDAYRVYPDGTVDGVVADKPTRLDRLGDRVVTADVPTERRRAPTLDEARATGLATLGGTVAAALGAPQDIEWAIADSRVWLLQARPITAAPPAPSASDAVLPGPLTLVGTPGSRGTATGTARTVRGPQDFARVREGDILICPFTDPAWTPLLSVAAGVVTETGGVLSHAAIVAREHHIPAVLGIPEATAAIPDGSIITIDGTTGTVLTANTRPLPPAR